MSNRSDRPAEDPETVWLRDVYQPDAVNLTVRAVLVGMLIGVLMCISNLYVFFKTGWSMGVTITAAILAWAGFRVAAAAGAKPLGPLENNALTTVASGAGYMTGGGNMAAFGALMMILAATPGVIEVPNTVLLIFWFATIAALGVFVAIPIKRQLVNKEALAFPTGTATAVTIKTLHAPGGDGASQAKALGYAALVAAALTWLRAGWKVISPTALTLPFERAGKAISEWTISISSELVLVGGGMLISFRTGWSMLLGGLLTYGVFAPSLFEEGVIKAAKYGEIVKWSMWPGAGILVGAGLTSLALDYRSLGRAFSGLRGVFGGKKRVQAEGIAAVESPEWWFPAAFAILAPIIVVLMVLLFRIPWWAGVVAVFLAVLMGFVAARVTGETDTTPTKALGPVTQMVFGGMTPGHLPANIMGANVTGGIGLHAADLLTTLKTGWLLGGRPRHQLYAQLFGVLVGAAILVPTFNVLFPDPSVLGSTDWPAPSSLVWKGVSEIVINGVSQLSPEAQLAMVIGLALGIGLTLLEKVAPKELKSFLPSPAGLGIAMVFPASNAIAMFLGASLAAGMRRYFPAAGKYATPIGSGLIAGESLMGVAIIIITKILGIIVAIEALDLVKLLAPVMS